jgi:hypothetical protein
MTKTVNLNIYKLNNIFRVHYIWKLLFRPQSFETGFDGILPSETAQCEFCFNFFFYLEVIFRTRFILERNLKK